MNDWDPTLFAAFLAEAKQRTYAAQGDEASVPPLLPGSRQLEYRDGPWYYRDVYFGGAFFVGQETVYHSGVPRWSMSYAGGVIQTGDVAQDLGKVYGFLRCALRLVTPDRPYRGPACLRDGDLSYKDESHGTLEDFWGAESITERGMEIYRLRYAGGLIR